MAASAALKRSILKHLYLNGPMKSRDIDKILHNYPTGRIAPILGAMKRLSKPLVLQNADKTWKLSAHGQVIAKQYADEDGDTLEPAYKWSIMAVQLTSLGKAETLNVGAEWEPFAGDMKIVYFRQLVEV